MSFGALIVGRACPRYAALADGHVHCTKGRLGMPGEDLLADRCPADRLTVACRLYEPVTAASLDAMPRMTSGASSASSQSAGRHRSP